MRNADEKAVAVLRGSRRPDAEQENALRNSCCVPMAVRFRSPLKKIKC